MQESGEDRVTGTADPAMTGCRALNCGWPGSSSCSRNMRVRKTSSEAASAQWKPSGE